MDEKRLAHEIEHYKIRQRRKEPDLTAYTPTTKAVIAWKQSSLFIALTSPSLLANIADPPTIRRSESYHVSLQADATAILGAYNSLATAVGCSGSYHVHSIVVGHSSLGCRGWLVDVWGRLAACARISLTTLIENVNATCKSNSTTLSHHCSGCEPRLR
jgi:hypothetical protein